MLLPNDFQNLIEHRLTSDVLVSHEKHDHWVCQRPRGVLQLVTPGAGCQIYRHFLSNPATDKSWQKKKTKTYNNKSTHQYHGLTSFSETILSGRLSFSVVVLKTVGTYRISSENSAFLQQFLNTSQSGYLQNVF